MTTTATRAGSTRLTVADVEKIIGAPFETTARRCHQISLAVVRSRRIPGARVARGMCRGVGGQHSWITVGNPYALGVQIIDPTLWSYDPDVKGIFRRKASSRGRHVPHGGAGSIWTYGKPCPTTTDYIELTPVQPLSPMAQRFLELVLPLDRTGWMRLAAAPVYGWPAAEIIAAMDDTEDLSALVPIDVLGMLTDRNPSRLYLPDPLPADAEQ